MTSNAEKNSRNLLPVVGGIVLLLLLVAVGGWYLFHLKSSASPPVPQTVRVDNSTSAVSETDEAPIEIPEQDAPTTPVPGFVDNFDNGHLNAAWTPIYGDPFIEDGRLTSHAGAGIAAGDPSWENYQIDFDVDVSQVDCTFVDSSNSVGVRVKDFGHAYWFVFNSCNAAWSFFAGGIDINQQGALSLLPNTKVDTSTKTKHITIQVDEAKMSASENGQLLTSITDSQYYTGGIFLQIEAQTFYDNFNVTLLP
jgi:hypothetical protein